MSTKAVPQIPPRPARSQNAAGPGPAGMPEVPPRPAQKRPDRSVSPNHFLQSPLYDAPSGYNLGRSTPSELSSLTLPARPPSVTLPSIGQEGNEYADIDFSDQAPEQSGPPEEGAQMRNIGGDLKLYAPKPSLPQASAKAQVKTVTRTDDQQAAAHGFGKAVTPSNDESEPFGRSPRLKAASITRSGSQPSGPPSRRQSIAPGEEEQGPAELGLRVPINPNMGDVQAPSPAPFSLYGDHHMHGKKRHHSRTKSGREVYLPPGSYGLHGHGVHSHDRFDKDWYAKHPDQYVHEETIGHGHYSATGSGRGEWALSSDDLNKIVRDTASRGSGFGTNEGVKSYPDEQIGYLASDQYSSRIASPSQGGGYLHKLHSNSSQPTIESPLQKTSFPSESINKGEFDRSKESVSGRSEAVDSEAEDDVIHVDDPARRYNKVTSGEETSNETEDLGREAVYTPDQGRYIDENGYGVPILASDEVAKDVGGEHMQPAVSPKQERRNSGYYLGDDYASGNTTPTSRPASRSAGTHGFNTSLSRFLSRHEDSEEMHTSLEDVDEYEPLFPDDDDDDDKKKPIDAAERFRQRPGTLRHRFPSQDIWEDTPSSAMHVTVVSALDLPGQTDSSDAKPASKTFEDPSVESTRKGEVDENERSKLVPIEERLAKSKFAPHLRDDMPTRPGMEQRFPSRDIWEDTPDSMRLVTTVTSPQPAGHDPNSPEDTTAQKPSVPPRPGNRSRLGESSTAASVPVSAEVRLAQVPARPPKRVHALPPEDAKLSEATIPPSLSLNKGISLTDGKKGPGFPDRPKPQVPARPAKKESLEALTKTVSGGSAGSQDTVTSPPMPRLKPSIPTRQGGNKSNLPTAFMSDLNQRLQLGPRAPVKEKDREPVEVKEVLPLSDARKGRARGPQRRAPAKSPSGSSETGPNVLPSFTISSPMPLWSINEEGGLMVRGPESVSLVTEDADSQSTTAAAIHPPDAATLVEEKGEGRSSPSKTMAGNTYADGSVPLEKVESTNEAGGRVNAGSSGVSQGQHGTLSKSITASSTSSREAVSQEATPGFLPAADEKEVLIASTGTGLGLEIDAGRDGSDGEHVGTGHGQMGTEMG